MNWYKFRTTVKIDGVLFTRGVHQVSEEIEMHDHFLVFVKAGRIEETEPPVTKTMPPDSKARAELLLKRLELKKSKKSVGDDEPAEEKKPKNGKKGKKSEPDHEGVQDEDVSEG